MAAIAAAMRTYLRDVIGVVDPVERREAIRLEGLESIQDFAEFEKEDIETLCASVRKPGGTIPNPNAAAPGAPATIPNPGFAIPAICEKRLISAAYTAKMYSMIGRDIDNNTMNRARLKKFDAHKRLIDEHQDPEKLPQVTKTFGIIKAMDLVPGHLRERLGLEKVALSYIIRDEVIPPPLEDLVNTVDNPNSATGPSFESIMDELIVHAPHSGVAYKEDNAKVFQILQDMVAGTSFESSIKSHQRARDGRAAYQALLKHNLGSSKWDKILEDAEAYVMKREWNGRNLRFSLRSHIAKHREAHNEMMRASQHVRYELPNEHTRVGRLIKSITSKDPSIVSAITHIQGTNSQRDDFESAAEFLLLTAPSAGNISGTHRVSVVNKGNKNGKKGSDTGIELRYYTKSEYNKLSNAEKKELHQLRNASKVKNDSDVGNSIVAVLQQQVKDLEDRLVSAIKTTQMDNKSVEEKRLVLANPLNQRS